MNLYNKYNFYKHTFCIWQEVTIDSVDFDAVDYSSKSGSKYVFKAGGVYRISNHWGRASNCRWRLNASKNAVNQKISVGFAKWIDFYPNDETSKLFFIVADVKSKTVQFFHKSDPLYTGIPVLRTANQTAKVMQHIKIILNETSWSTYLKFDDFETLQHTIIEELITSDKNFLEIKRSFL